MSALKGNNLFKNNSKEGQHFKAIHRQYSRVEVCKKRQEEFCALIKKEEAPSKVQKNTIEGCLNNYFEIEVPKALCYDFSNFLTNDKSLEEAKYIFKTHYGWNDLNDYLEGRKRLGRTKSDEVCQLFTIFLQKRLSESFEGIFGVIYAICIRHFLKAIQKLTVSKKGLKNLRLKLKWPKFEVRHKTVQNQSYK